MGCRMGQEIGGVIVHRMRQEIGLGMEKEVEKQAGTGSGTVRGMVPETVLDSTVQPTKRI